jgi:hypothetical protein
MNIFVLDWDVKKCAMYHVNKHTTKMCVEYAQLLCGVHHTTESNVGNIPYRLSHKNHPCSIWARESMDNYLWLCELGMELCAEYTFRYGKRHKSQQVIEWCIDNRPNIPEEGFTVPAKAMPDQYKVEDVVQSYRNYYLGEKKSICNWKNRNTPSWFLTE